MYGQKRIFKLDGVPTQFRRGLRPLLLLAVGVSDNLPVIARQPTTDAAAAADTDFIVSRL